MIDPISLIQCSAASFTFFKWLKKLIIPYLNWCERAINHPFSQFVNLNWLKPSYLCNAFQDQALCILNTIKGNHCRKTQAPEIKSIQRNAIFTKNHTLYSQFLSTSNVPIPKLLLTMVENYSWRNILNNGPYSCVV